MEKARAYLKYLHEAPEESRDEHWKASLAKGKERLDLAQKSDGFAPAPAAGCDQPDHYKLTASSLSLTLKQKQIGCCQDKVWVDDA